MSLEVIRIYQSEIGVWRIEFKRDGKLYWSSLHTRNHAEAMRQLAKWREYEARMKDKAADG